MTWHDRSKPFSGQDCAGGSNLNLELTKGDPMHFRTQSLAALAAMALVLTPALAGCGQTAENVAE